MTASDADDDEDLVGNYVRDPHLEGEVTQKAPRI
jgi:hypothetical protein